MRPGLEKLLETMKPKTIRGSFRSSRKSTAWCLKNIDWSNDREAEATMRKHLAELDEDIAALDLLIEAEG